MAGIPSAILNRIFPPLILNLLKDEDPVVEQNPTGNRPPGLNPAALRV